MVGEKQMLNSACPAAYIGGLTQSLQTPAMSSDMDYRITDSYHHAGIYLVTGNGQVSLMHWLCSGGWGNTVPVAAATLVPVP